MPGTTSTAELNFSTPVGIRFSMLAKEPFRIFFPLAVLFGIVGVSLWPLHFWGVLPWYPGPAHARLMAYGLFGGFILGFLGTAMPRMLSATPLRSAEAALLTVVYGTMAGAFAMGSVRWGDVLLIVFLLVFLGLMIGRFSQRKDTPPPGFLLVGLSFLSVIGGAVIAVVQEHRDLDLFWINLQHLLSYQGFVLFPIMGIGPFILPRFFGLPSSHDFPETLAPSERWFTKAILALMAGLLVVGSFVVEARGWFRSAYALRFFTVAVYVWLEMPFRKAPRAGSALGGSLRFAFLSLVSGFLAIALFPTYRVALLHLTLIGGFAVITFVVATRVVFGHSGNIDRLKGRNRWLGISVGLMLFAMITRVSGDFWPKIMASHYSYGAILWIASVALWATKVLPKVTVIDPE